MELFIIIFLSLIYFAIVDSFINYMCPPTPYSIFDIAKLLWYVMSIILYIVLAIGISHFFTGLFG